MPGSAHSGPTFSASMIETPIPGPVPRFELTEWRERYRIVAGITGRGEEPLPFDLGLAGTAAPVGLVMDRWRRLAQSLPEFSGLTLARQVHGTRILSHGACTGLVIHEGADGHTTDRVGTLLAVTVADCVPVFVADVKRRVIALLHAGWRGVAGGILPKALDLLALQGSHVDDLLVHCGVGICGDCYEVGPEVLEAVGLAAPSEESRGLDLRALLASQAAHRGVEKVSTSGLCSRHDGGLFFSHRGSGGQDGRMVAYLGLLP